MSHIRKGIVHKSNRPENKSSSKEPASKIKMLRDMQVADRY